MALRFLGWLFRRYLGLPLWAKGAVLVGLPLALLNLSVAFFGQSAVFPLSPFFLKEKTHALARYAAHRPGCLLRGHPDLEGMIRQAEARHRIPPGLLRAVIEVESELRPHRISPAGAMGPAQLMPGTAKELGVVDPFDSAEAVDGAGRYLGGLLRKKGDVRLAVASYNAGPGAVRGRVPDNAETPAYVAKVLRAYRAAR